MKNRSLVAQLCSGLLLAVVTLVLTACGQVIYKDPAYTFGNRAVPPSGLLQRVLASYTANGSSGGLEVLDALRDIRSNVQNTIPYFFITGYTGGNPSQIFNFPEQSVGYVFSSSDGGLTGIDYGKEASGGAVASFASTSPSVAVASNGSRFLGAQESAGQLAIFGAGGSYYLNLPNINKVVVNQGNTVILAMVRNSNALYRVVKLNSTINTLPPPGYVDCQPLILPVYCIVPVPGTYDRPSDAYFSLDGATAYILDCGPECGGTTAGITALQEGQLTIDVIPTSLPYPSPMSALPVANPIPIPGGVTTALSDGSRLYVAGQSQKVLSGGALVTDPVNPGLFTGYLTTVNLGTYAVSTPVSISDGPHNKLLFADDSTLWIGSQQCASGKRAAIAAAQLASTGVTTQAGNYNCLTMASIGGATVTAQIVPAVVQSTVSTTAPVTVSFPNTNQNQFYYGSLTGLCWVQNFHKVYTAYGGQVHVFYTGSTGVAGSEIDNTNVTVQGTVLDVAYMDATTNSAN